MKLLAKSLLAWGLVTGFSWTAFAQDRLSYELSLVKQVVTDIENRTPFRFLYRDALIAGLRVSFTSSQADVLDKLHEAIGDHGLRLHVDQNRKQVLILRSEAGNDSRPSAMTVSGFVMDRETGEPLPHATVTWRADDGWLAGSATNENGRFTTEVDRSRFERSGISMTASFVGYEPITMTVSETSTSAELPFRLSPVRSLTEVIVTGLSFTGDLDTTRIALANPNSIGVLGEGNVLRAMQMLPGVQVAPTLSRGITVRGSRGDEFQVLLDGVAIYGRQHLFGLFDSFNPDALKLVGLYYGVAPASLEGPPAGTASFVTRTGSRTGFESTVSTSNAAIRATLEGPLLLGKGSWLVAARGSYVDRIPWFNNEEILLRAIYPFLSDSELRPGIGDREVLGADAGFYDVHANTNLDIGDGSVLTISGYVASDAVSSRVLRRRQGNQEVSLDSVSSSYDWDTVAASARLFQQLGPSVSLSSTLTGSRYSAASGNSDFLFRGQPARSDSMSGLGVTSGLFEESNRLVEFKLAQSIDWTLAEESAFTTGYSLHAFDNYFTSIADVRSRELVSSRRSTQFDLFTEYATGRLRPMQLSIGLRTHYFSRGSYLRASPRLTAQLNSGKVSASVGVSQNHQFLHRLQIANTAAPDMWVMSSEGEPPTRVNQVNAGITVIANENLSLRAEAYVKDYASLWNHTENLQRLQGNQNRNAPRPWSFDDAVSRGLELSLTSALHPVKIGASYVLSRTTIQSSDVEDQRAFDASWDRRHQATLSLSGKVLRKLGWNANWFFGTGVPNELQFAQGEEPRLPDYHRLDVGLTTEVEIEGSVVALRFGVSNLYDRQNVWYREALPGAQGRADRPDAPARAVSIYDLGRQSSFQVSIRF